MDHFRNTLRKILAKPISKEEKINEINTFYANADRFLSSNYGNTKDGKNMRGTLGNDVARAKRDAASKNTMVTAHRGQGQGSSYVVEDIYKW